MVMEMELDAKAIEEYKSLHRMHLPPCPLAPRGRACRLLLGRSILRGVRFSLGTLPR